MKVKARNLRSPYCKACDRVAQREWRRKNAERINAARRARYTPEQGRRGNLKRYGITLEQYNDLLVGQGGGCAVCGEVREWRGRVALHVDHSHVTGEVRGLLCHACNVSLGALDEDVERIRRLALYAEGRLYEETTEAEA